MAAQKKIINFLSKGGLEKGPLGKVLKWALTLGRYIVIFTELIVIIIFISRFKLDKDLTDLHEEIGRKQSIIAASQELENEVRFLQKRLSAIDKVQPEKIEIFLILKELSQIIPLDLVFSELEIKKDSVSLAGTSLSNIGLATFIAGLKSSEQFQQLELKSVSSGGEKDPTLEFQIWASLSQKKNNGY